MRLPSVTLTLFSFLFPLVLGTEPGHSISELCPSSLSLILRWSCQGAQADLERALLLGPPPVSLRRLARQCTLEAAFAPSQGSGCLRLSALTSLHLLHLELGVDFGFALIPSFPG